MEVFGLLLIGMVVASEWLEHSPTHPWRIAPVGTITVIVSICIWLIEKRRHGRIVKKQ